MKKHRREWDETDGIGTPAVGNDSDVAGTDDATVRGHSNDARCYRLLHR